MFITSLIERHRHQEGGGGGVCLVPHFCTLQFLHYFNMIYIIKNLSKMQRFVNSIVFTCRAHSMVFRINISLKIDWSLSFKIFIKILKSLVKVIIIEQASIVKTIIKQCRVDILDIVKDRALQFHLLHDYLMNKMHDIACKPGNNSGNFVCITSLTDVILLHKTFILTV